MSQKLQIEVVSDFVCPWCYIGKKRLEQALEMCPDIDAEVVWQPFQLSPDMPREGRNKQQHYAEIFGAEKAQEIAGRMQQTGEAEGIAFGSSVDAVSPNTLSAHVLLQWAEENPAVDVAALAERLFDEHHVNCSNIGDHALLAEIAAEFGMDHQQVLVNLAAGKDEEMVKNRIKDAVSRGVSGVPFFIVNGRYGLSGAQPPELLAETFAKAVSERAG